MSNKQSVSSRTSTFSVLVHFTLLVYLAVAQNSTTASESDRQALLEIKSMISTDPEGVMNSWNESNTNFCEWQGVSCSSRHQRVTVLDLRSSGLVGTLSPSIGNLSFLRNIRLMNNSLSGEIPPEIGRLFRLEELRIYNNSFTGNIPTTIANCTNLQALHLGYNNLVGRIPDGIGSFSNLNTLILHGNILEGGIPMFIANLTMLEVLSLGDCQLGGIFPDIFHRLTRLQRIALPGNNLVGTIPPSFYNLSVLEQVFIDNNRVSGTLPANLGSQLPRLLVFSLSQNQFTGVLPTSVLSAPQLTILDVASNNFSGKLTTTSQTSCNLDILSLGSNNFGTGEPDEMKFIDDLSVCSQLGVFDLFNNQLTGFLPESLGNLSSTLYFLRVASNRFSGSLPSSVGKLSGLTLLDLSNNQLSGELPATIGNLESVRRIDLTNNSFSGNIPSSIGNLSEIIDLYLTSNQFNGTIPSTIGNCKRLLRLNLDQNNLTGDIPREVFELESLSISLNLGNNQLSGRIPVEVGNLKSLTEIVLSNNRLSGELPGSLGSCSSLQNLNISNNFFSGSFPPSLGSLRALENLDVSHNNFTGEIPSYLEEIPLMKLNISYNDFNGQVLRKGVFANASLVSIVGNDRLCGGIPELELPKCGSNKKKKLSLVVILVISIVPVLVLVTAVLFFVCFRHKKDTEDETTSLVSGESLVHVSFETLHKATDGFSTKNFIGDGSFSSVYKGCLDPNGVNYVAVKVLNLHRRGGSKSFLAECDVLRNARHRNLTKVVTCCSGIDYQGNEFKAIVYEFMPNGSLDRWLHSPKNEFYPLSLIQRVSIALDVAYALDYLHLHAGKTIIHCDLKPSNILLDEDMVAHVADFGISKILQSEYNQNRHNTSSTGVRGTIGYAAPEYGLGSEVSRSGDMYSYGILLLEMMTCKKPTDVMFGDGVSLHNYVKKAINDDDNGALAIVDPVLLQDDEKIGARTNKEEITGGYMNHERCLRLLLEIGVSCSIESPQYRMETSGVIQELHLIKDAILGNSSL